MDDSCERIFFYREDQLHSAGMLVIHVAVANEVEAAQDWLSMSVFGHGSVSSRGSAGGPTPGLDFGLPTSTDKI